MKGKYVIDLSVSGISELKNGLAEYRRWLDQKSEELAERLASMGALKASLGFARAVYSGNNDVSIEVEQTGPCAFKVIASGNAVLFVEFGSGLIGGGHPEPQGFGPGTYPGKGHWDDANGWWYGKGEHTFGNPPACAMYNSVKELEIELERVVREVFVF